MPSTRMRKSPSSRPPLLPALWLKLLDHEPIHRPLWLRWGVAIAVTVLALWLRMQMGSPQSGARFATLTLATALSALFGGVSAGMLSALLGMLLANFYFLAPFGQMALKDPTEAFWLNATFLITQILILGAIWAMQLRNRHLHEVTRELEESRNKFQHTFEHAAAGISHVGLQGQLLNINQTFCDLVGYTAKELGSMSFQDITHPDDIEPDLRMLAEALAGQRSHYSLEKRYFHKDGHLIWAQLTVALMRKPDGEPDYFISVVQDISASKATDEALRTSERLMSKAQGVAKFITWDVDIATRRFRTFGNIHESLGLPPTDFSIERVLTLTHPDDHERLEKEWITAIKGKNSFHGIYRGHPSSQVAWYQVSANFDRGADGRVTYAYGVNQDISDRMVAELEIKDLNASLENRIQDRTQELKDAYAELESYSYAVAHDLRSPLRIINGFAQALEDDNTTLTGSSLTHIQRIKSSSQKMGQLIDGLLKLAQLARGEVNRQPVNISAIAQQLLEELARDEPHRKVEWDIEPGLNAQADPNLIEALLQNLLHNAWKYSAQTPLACIKVFKESDGDETRFCVSDNGAGFNMQHASKLFQPFQRLHMPHEFGGLGIGLATAQRIVKRHGGELSATGEAGKGARFSFTLPNPDAVAEA